jgi:hypothetical protein
LTTYSIGRTESRRNSRKRNFHEEANFPYGRHNRNRIGQHPEFQAF